MKGGREMINKNKLGLTIGIFVALMHLVWVIAVAIGIQRYLDWVLLLHSIKLDIVLTQVVLLNAVMLLVLAFVGGYIFGYVFAAIWNYINKK